VRTWLRPSSRAPRTRYRELRRYREELLRLTAPIDRTLTALDGLIDELRRRAIDPEAAIERLQAGEEELDAAADAFREMRAPEELHALHMEYEANLERALRGIVTAARGCGITRQRHRPVDDEEPQNYWKRGHSNIVHAALRMREVLDTMMNWEPGRPAEVSVETRLHRSRL